MARGRFLSKSISTNERFTTVSDRARLLWLMALPHADVEGLLPGSKGELGATAVPSLLLTYRWTIPDVEAARDELVAAGLWLLHTDAFQRQVVEVCRFKDHQTLQTEKEGKSRYLGVRTTPESTPESAPEQGASGGDAQVKVSEVKRSEVKARSRAKGTPSPSKNSDSVFTDSDVARISDEFVALSREAFGDEIPVDRLDEVVVEQNLPLLRRKNGWIGDSIKHVLENGGERSLRALVNLVRSSKVEPPRPKESQYRSEAEIEAEYQENRRRMRGEFV